MYRIGQMYITHDTLSLQLFIVEVLLSLNLYHGNLVGYSILSPANGHQMVDGIVSD